MMDYRLIAFVALAALAVALGFVAFLAVHNRSARRDAKRDAEDADVARRDRDDARRDRDDAVREAAMERQGRKEAKTREAATSQRLDAVHEYVGKIMQGTPQRPPHRMWRVKAWAWLGGFGIASVAARTTPGAGGAATATLSLKAVALTSAAVLAATGGISLAVLDKPDLDKDEHPLSSAVVAAPPMTRPKVAAPVPVVAATRPTEAETTTPATTSTPTPSATPNPTTTLTPTTSPTKPPPPTTQSRDTSASHTTTAASPDQAPPASVAVRGTPGTTPAPTDAAPKAAPAPAAAPVDDTKIVRPVPETSATKAASASTPPTSRTCLDLTPVPVLVCVG